MCFLRSKIHINTKHKTAKFKIWFSSCRYWYYSWENPDHKIYFSWSSESRNNLETSRITMQRSDGSSLTDKFTHQCDVRSHIINTNCNSNKMHLIWLLGLCSVLDTVSTVTGQCQCNETLSQWGPTIRISIGLRQLKRTSTRREMWPLIVWVVMFDCVSVVVGGLPSWKLHVLNAVCQEEWRAGTHRPAGSSAGQSRSGQNSSQLKTIESQALPRIQCKISRSPAWCKQIWSLR